MSKILIVTNGNYFARLILTKLIDSPKHTITGVVIVNGDYKGNSGFKTLYDLAKSTTFPYLFYKISIYFIFKILKAIGQRKDLEVVDLLEEKKINYLSISKINSAEVSEFIKSKNPEILVSVSCPQKINQKILKLASLANINIHSSFLPSYAGLAPYFWVLAKGEKVTATTVHYMTKKFDEGNILIQSEFKIPEGISAFMLFRELAILGQEALLKAIELVEDRKDGQLQDLSRRSYFSHPDWHSYIALRKRGYCLIRLADVVKILRESQGRVRIDNE